MPQSKHKPYIRNLQDQILVPYNCKTTVDSETEDILYEFSLLKHSKGRSINDFNYWLNLTRRQLNADLQAYIYQYYDQGIQATINGYATKALSEDRDDIVIECKKVQNWIDLVLDYYDNIKSQLLSATNENERIMTSWNFPNNVPIDNYIDWRNLKSMF